MNNVAIDAGRRLQPRRINHTSIALHVIVIFLCAITIFPFFWMLSTSFKMPDEVFTPDIRLLPTNPTFQNYPDAFSFFPLARWIWNSVAISVVITVGKVALSIPPAYAFGRMKFRGDKLLFAVVLATMIVPGVVTTIPNYILISDWGLINTWAGVILPSLPGSAFSIFLWRQSVRQLPQDIFDAAKLDGASTYQTLRQIVIPNIKSAIAVVVVLTFLGAWNMYLWPLLVLSDYEMKTLPIAMQLFAGNQDEGPMWGPMMAVASMTIIPPMALYAVAQKQIVNSFMTSGIKG